ncbi:hypothetical protein L2E82_02836 [Cichorium intybus]|uniref:Uncharacterized protein n=1 Tax=Cichorium intybus TaxID=13427 RepID=A0ACB9H2V9_CICIN|nr:hypothetical protein L2E82_02836 [Cichorium intybus]
MSENGDGLDYLRIPFEKIKFGKKLEGHGYGSVFEGEFGDRRVALKQLNITNLGNIKPKLLGEILTISRFRQHPNLVALLGFCDERSNEIILVYEYVASGNLADKMRKRLTTIQRFEICLGAARGLDYLHTGVDSTTPGLVHGHVKLSKILLNSDSDSNSSKFEAKLSSFGLSKIVPGKTQTDPEDEVNEKPTKESDVYSFGVLLLEVLCGVSELVDTDDYQERHVTELVPKRLAQEKVRKIVHFDIRREIKTEALETYAKIACQCVVDTPEARPTMTQVVEELEKALRLQGGEVTYVQILRSENINGAPDGTVADDGPKEDGNEVTVDSNTLDKEPEEAEIVTIKEDAKEVISQIAGEDHGDEITVVGMSSESANGEKSSDDITTQERSFDFPMLDNVNGESLPDRTQIKDAQEESSEILITGTDDLETTEEITDDLNYSKQESNITEDTQKEDSCNTVITSTNDPETIEDLNSKEEPNITSENEDDNQSKSQIEDVQKESSNSNTDDPETTEEIIDDSNSKEESESEILESGKTLPKEIEDGLEYLRIPFQKLKFGNKIDIDGYGSMFDGEFDNQQVALKRLNITNLGNIKPKLLSEILNVARFQKHPNLVALIGFCDEKTNEIIIVYEYVSGGNLADNLSKHLTTIQRLEICLGAARGVNYLHSGLDPITTIIHGDIKLSKILLKLDSISSKFEAKVSSFGLSKLLPGKSQTILEPEEKTKESDVYCFGVLLLEVLCGVPELVDTDDYQERHVTELVPKRLEQNMLRKIVHFDIRDEIRTEALETYAKIACLCVMENPEERPTMDRVVEELEKALKLQDGDVSEVQVLGSSNGDGLPERTVDEDDEEGDDNGEKRVFNATEDESRVIEEANIDDIVEQPESFPNNGESVPDIAPIDEAKTECDKQTDNPESIEETIADIKSNIIEANGVDNENKMPLTSLESNNGDIKDAEQEQENSNALPMTTNEDESKEEIMDDKITPMEISMEVHNTGILDSEKENAHSKIKLHGAKKEPEPIIETREIDFNDFETTNLISSEKTQETKSKRSNSTSSESSNGGDTTLSDSLLQKSSPNVIIKKKTTYDSRGCCPCSWWNLLSNSLNMLQTNTIKDNIELVGILCTRSMIVIVVCTVFQVISNTRLMYL